MGWLVRRDLRGRTGAKCHGVGRQARQPASPMEGEVRLALTATRSLLALGPRNNLPADEPSIDGHRHRGHAMAEMEGGQRLPIVPCAPFAGVLAARPLVDPDTFGDEPAVRPLMHDDRHAGSEWNVSDCDLWRHNDP